jgi:hypothetical protein
MLGGNGVPAPLPIPGGMYQPPQQTPPMTMMHPAPAVMRAGPPSKRQKVLPTSETRVLLTDSESLAFYRSDFPEGDFEQLLKSCGLPKTVIDAAQRRCASVGWEFKSFISKLPSFPQDQVSTLHNIRPSRVRAANVQRHQWVGSQPEDFILVPKPHPMRAWFSQHIQSPQLTETPLEMDADEYLLYLKARLAENPILERRRFNARPKRKAKSPTPTSEPLSPSRSRTAKRQKTAQTEIEPLASKSAAVSRKGRKDSIDNSKIKGQAPLMPIAGLVFDDIPSNGDFFHLSRKQEHAYHQPIYSFREISDSIRGMLQENIDEQGKRNVIEDMSIPVMFNSSLLFVPRDLSLIVSDLSVDGFEDIPSDFVNPTLDKRQEQYRGKIGALLT